MKFYKPDFGTNPNSPFARDANNNLVRKSYWYDMTDASIISLFNIGIGAILDNEEKKNHLKDIKREHLIEDICVQEILPSDSDI